MFIYFFLFVLNHTSTTKINTYGPALSLHVALPIVAGVAVQEGPSGQPGGGAGDAGGDHAPADQGVVVEPQAALGPAEAARHVLHEEGEADQIGRAHV